MSDNFNKPKTPRQGDRSESLNRAFEFLSVRQFSKSFKMCALKNIESITDCEVTTGMATFPPMSNNVLPDCDQKIFPDEVPTESVGSDVSALRLADLNTWKKIRCFSAATKLESRSELGDQGFLRASLIQRFWTEVVRFAPGHHLGRASVQRSVIQWLELHRSFLNAGENLLKERERSWVVGFQYACEWLLGDDWGNKPANGDSLVAMTRGNEMFKMSPQQAKREAVGNGRSTPLKFSVQKLIVRHWTNPDFPFWLMGNKAISQAVGYLSNGDEHLSDESVVTTIRRIGLTRLRHRPIAGISFDLAPVSCTQSGAKRQRFREYTFATYLKKELGHVTVKSRKVSEVDRMRVEGCHLRFPPESTDWDGPEHLVSI